MRSADNFKVSERWKKNGGGERRVRKTRSEWEINREYQESEKKRERTWKKGRTPLCACIDANLYLLSLSLFSVFHIYSLDSCSSCKRKRMLGLTFATSRLFFRHLIFYLCSAENSFWLFLSKKRPSVHFILYNRITRSVSDSHFVFADSSLPSFITFFYVACTYIMLLACKE